MSNKRYVPEGVYLTCDKGTTPTEFKITNNNNSFLFENPIANTGDMAAMVNVIPFGSCSVKNGSPCAPVPVAWQGFEDGIFIGNFNPLLEDSVLPCGVGGKIEIHYSLEEAEASCAEEGGGFWSTLGKVALVVATVALIVVTGGMAVAAIAAVGAASGALATGVLVTVAALEVAGCLLTAKALYDYSQDGNEEALLKEVALGFLFLGAGAAIAKAGRAILATRTGEKGMKIVGDVVNAVEELPVLQFSRSKMPNISKNIDEAVKAGHPTKLARESDKAAIRANRKAALDGANDAGVENSLDEYPFASSKQGGAGANVKSVPKAEQNIQGGTLSSFYKKNCIQDGDEFIVEIIN